MAQFPNATPFHTANWCSVLAEAYGFEPCYFHFEGPLPALLPMFQVSSWFTGRRGVSLPFTDFCDPLIGSETKNSRVAFDGSAALQRLIAFGSDRDWKYLELRGADSLFSHSTPGPTFAPPAAPSQIVHRTSYIVHPPQFLTHTLDLTGGETALWRGLSAGCQRAIRKARTVGVTIRKADFSSPRSSRDLRAFYNLQCRTRRKHGLPPQPYRFFELIQRHMLEAGLGSLYLAEVNGKDTDDKVADRNVADCKVIAGALYLHFGSSVVFKYGASDDRHLDLRANNLVMWQAIADYAAAGFRTLNFGRTEFYNSGLKRYKMAFGTQEQRLNYHRYNYSTKNFVQQTGSRRLTQLARSIFRILPLPAARCLGTVLYPHAA